MASIKYNPNGQKGKITYNSDIVSGIAVLSLRETEGIELVSSKNHGIKICFEKEGVFVDISVITVAPIALAIGQRAGYNKAALLLAMIGGRIVSGLANALFMGLANAPYGFQMFLTASFVTALPGILIQIIVIPLLVLALQKAGFLTRD